MNNVAESGKPVYSETLYGSGPAQDDNKQPINKGIIYSFIVLCLVLILSVQWAYSYISDMLAPTSYAYITASGDRVVLDRSAQKTFAELLSRKTSAFEASLTAELDPIAKRGVDASYEHLQKGVEAYLDWYFSISGSYMRMYVALTQDLDEWSETQIQERLIEESEFPERLVEFENEYRQQQIELTKSELHATQEALDEFLQTRGDKISPEELTPEIPLLDLSIVTEASDVLVDIERVEKSIAVGGFSGVAAGVASLGGVRAATVFAKQFTARMVGHGVRAAASGALSAAATIFTGPGAVIVGAAVTGASIASFIGLEYLALNAQEALYRPQMEKDLRDFIESKRQETIVNFKRNTRQLIGNVVQTIQQNVAHQEQLAEIPRTYRVWRE